MMALVRRLAARHALFLALSGLVLAAFEFIIPAVIAGLDLPELLGDVLARLPPPLGEAMADQVFGGLSPAGLLGFGWNHPVAHAAGTAVAVSLGARAVAGEVDEGTLELELAQPISRSVYLSAQIAFAVAALAGLTAAGLLGTLAGTRFFGVAAGGMAVTQVAVNFLLLLLALYATTLAASAGSRENARALGIGFMVAVASFLINAVALLWPAAAWLEPFTLHAYHQPREVLATGLAGLPVIVLAGWTALWIAVAFWRFRRRDVP